MAFAFLTTRRGRWVRFSRAATARPRSFACVALVGLLTGCGGSETGGASAEGEETGARAAGTALVGLEADTAPTFERVVIVTIDTLRADHLASYGYFRTTSPFLDELAEESVLFERAMSASSHTAPSHASMFTGLPPGLHGLLTNGSRLGADVATMADACAAAGFETAAFTSVEFLAGVAEGFDTLRAKTTKAGGISNAAITWMRKERSSDRFLLWLHYYDPHRWKSVDRVPPDHAESLRAATTLAPDAAYAEVARLHDLPMPFEPRDWRSGDKGVEEVTTATRDDVLAYVDSYDGQITYADAEIARVYRALERLELEGETLWIFTSDHGEGLGSHDYAGHGWQVYQEQLHVPLLIHGTGGSLPARRVPGLVTLLDLFPTVLDALGGSLRGPLTAWTGRSLLPVLQGAELNDSVAFAQRRPLRKTGGDGVFALQDERFKFILRMTGEDEFYDLVLDPQERENRVTAGGVDLERLRADLEARLEVFASRGLVAEEGAEEWLEELQKLGYAR